MNFIYKKLSDVNEKELLDCLKLWNDEMGLIYPITQKAFYQNVIDYSEKDGLVAYCDNQVKGFIFLKQFSDDKLVDYTNNLFISLFYVSKKYRRQGVGSTLFDFANKICGKRDLIIGKDIYNFFPGVPTDFDNLTDVWLEKRGFTGHRYTHDLIARNPKSYEIKNKEVVYKYCEDEEKDKLIEFIKKNNWKRWALEVEEYFSNKKENDEKAYIIGLLYGEIISFVRVNTNEMNIVAYNVMWQNRFEKLGGIGPLGVDKEQRKSGLGKDMMSIAINDLLKKGCKELMIDWTGLMELYSKFNFEVWKSYKYMQKNQS